MRECRARERGTGDRCTREDGHPHWTRLYHDDTVEWSNCDHWAVSEPLQDLPEACEACGSTMGHRYAPVQVPDTSHLPKVPHLIEILTCDPQPTWFPRCSCGELNYSAPGNNSYRQDEAVEVAHHHLKEVGALVEVEKSTGGKTRHIVKSKARIEFPMGYEPDRPLRSIRDVDDIPF